ncbi:hypothetical protein TWF751_006178 [Orbilia oligospora]|nr:hypothetical protein TWF751_006178 [Orbilia oligospora]
MITQQKSQTRYRISCAFFFLLGQKDPLTLGTTRHINRTCSGFLNPEHDFSKNHAVGWNCATIRHIRIHDEGDECKKNKIKKNNKLKIPKERFVGTERNRNHIKNMAQFLE